MVKYVPTAGACSLDVWTYKEGLLSAVAHDLRIGASELTVAASVENGRFSVRFVVPVRGLRVLGAVKGGVVSPMSEKDRLEIEKNLTTVVLDAAKHPEVIYVGEGSVASGETTGELTLRGTTRPLPLRLVLTEDKRVEGEVRFSQTAFGVKPYSALLGTLKVKDEVRVSWSLVLAPQT